MVCNAKMQKFYPPTDLSKPDQEDSDGDEDGPDHNSLVQILGPVATLGLPQAVVSLVVDHSVHVLVDLPGRGLHLERRRDIVRLGSQRSSAGKQEQSQIEGQTVL